MGEQLGLLPKVWPWRLCWESLRALFELLDVVALSNGVTGLVGTNLYFLLWRRPWVAVVVPHSKELPHPRFNDNIEDSFWCEEKVEQKEPQQCEEYSLRRSDSHLQFAVVL